ncbi:MAG: hypothetical protein VX803_04335 [Pseudomonadota bacterium]|nr:hypothetical protein [Pseudomonadota bacterium]
MSGDQAHKDDSTQTSAMQPTLKAEKPQAIVVAETLTINALNQNMKKGNDNLAAERADKTADRYDADDADTVLQLGHSHSAEMEQSRKLYSYIAYAGIVASILWFFYSAVYFARSDMAFDPASLSGALTGILTPLALFWLCFGHFARRNDVALYAQNLRAEMEGLLFPSKQHALRVNKDIQLLCQQVAEMNTNSRAALKSIQRARHGLRNEIRDFAGMAGKAEFHVDRLSDVLEKRKTDLMACIEDIQTNENILKDHAQNGLDAWRAAEQDILGISQTVEEKMYKGTERITKATEAAHAKAEAIDGAMETTYQSMQSAVDNFGLRLDGLSSDFDGHVEALSASADRVSDETDRLGAHIRQEIDGLEKMTIEAIEAMAESSMSIEAQRRELTNGVVQLSEEATTLSSRISDASENMDEIVQLAVARSIEIEERIDKQTSRLGDVSRMLDDKASAIEKSGDHIAAQLGDAMSVAVSGAETLRSAVRKASEELERTTGNTVEAADDLLEKVTLKFDNLNDHAVHNMAKIRQVTNSFDDVIIKLDQSVLANSVKINDAMQIVDKKTQELDASCKDLILQTEDVVSALAEPLSQIADAGQELELKQENVAKSISNRTDDLLAAGDRVLGQAENVKEMLLEQIQTLSTLGGEISGHSNGLEEHVRTQRELLTGYLSAMMEKVDAHKQGVENLLSSINNVNDDIEISVGRFEEDMTDYVVNISTKSSDAKTELKNLENAYFDHWSKIESYGAKSVKKVGAAIETLKLSAQETLPYYDEVLERVDRAENRFKDLNVGFETLSEESIARINRLKDSVENTAHDLNSNVSESITQLRVQEDNLRQTSDAMKETAQDATQQLKAVEQRLNDQEDNIRLIADKMELRIDGLNETIGTQFMGLTQSVGQAVAQLSDAASRFELTAGRVKQNANEGTDAITAANDKTLANIETLLAAGKRCASENEKAIHVLDQKTAKLLDTTKDSRDAIARAGDGFVIRAREFEEYIKASLNTTKDYVVELKTQAHAVAEASEGGADQIRVSIADIHGQMGQIVKSARDVSKHIGDAGLRLEEEGDKLNMRARSATALSENAASELSRHSNNLAKSVRDAELAIERIAEVRQKSQQEAFMDSAKFIVESLHSLSVDITRQIKDGDIDDKTWKAFKKGDVAAFTRRLVDIDFEQNTDKLKDKYEKDNAFRSYTMRFIKQFEEIIEHAYATSHADILCAAFLSSDLGKLYQGLCFISGRQGKKIMH